MESLRGASNWKLTVRRSGDHMEILRGVTCDACAVLPEELFGLPVTVLGDHALTPGAAPVSGEEVCILGGPEGEWNNRELRELTLPAPLTEVKDYALYGCRGLHTLRLHDRVERWGGGCLMNCDCLTALHLTRVEGRQGEALAFLCGELHEELDVTIRETDGGLTRLLFPAFAETYRENFANHHFDYSIRGGGYRYHHVFSGKQLVLRAYDELWENYLREEYEPECALRMAYLRLRRPTGLSAYAWEQYAAYLRRNGEAALLWQLTQRDAQGLAMLLELLKPGEESLHLACEQARRAGDTQSLSLLLEQRREKKAGGFDRNFEL